MRAFGLFSVILQTVTPTKNWLKDFQSTGKKCLSVLFDPDDSMEEMHEVLETALMHGIDLFLVGGSLITRGNTQQCVQLLKNGGAPRVILFPGNEIQVAENADGILFISLVSGRNPEYLIGKQVTAAPAVKKSGMEVLSCAYMLVDGGKTTSANYISQTLPIPGDKPEIAVATAMAAEMMGMQHIYMDAGSGAIQPVPEKMIQAVRNNVQGVLIVGGGIRNASDAVRAWSAGADVVVIGNGAFENPGIIKEMSTMLQKLNSNNIVV